MRIIPLFCASFLMFGCGGGGSTSSNNNNELINENEETGTSTYSCATNALNQESFNIPSGRPDFTKKTGFDLATYFGYDVTNEFDAEEERKSSYITKSFQEYHFGRLTTFKQTNFAPFTIQSLFKDWYLVGDNYRDSAAMRVRVLLDEDSDPEEYSFETYSSSTIDTALSNGLNYGGPLLLGSSSNRESARYADVGDTIHYQLTTTAAGQLETYCAVSNETISTSITSSYPNALPISCIAKSEYGTLFTGIKTNLIVAPNVGVISEVEDSYFAIIENTQDTNRICRQEIKELVSTEVVERVYLNELDSVTP